MKHEWPKNQWNSLWSTKKPTNYNILLSNILTNVSVAYRCLLCNTTTCPDLLKQMFKMSPSSFHTSKKTLSPLAYSCVDGRQLFPDCSNCIHAVRRCCRWVADTRDPELGSKSCTRFKSGLFRGHRDGEMKSGTSFSNSSTVARFAGALSCWKVKKSDSSHISGSRPCLNRTRYLTAECCDSLVFLWNLVNFVGFSVIHVSQGSVATYVTYGGMQCIANFLLSLSVKEFLKSVKIWQSYCQKFRGLVFLEHGARDLLSYVP